MYIISGITFEAEFKDYSYASKRKITALFSKTKEDSNDFLVMSAV